MRRILSIIFNMDIHAYIEKVWNWHSRATAATGHTGTKPETKEELKNMVEFCYNLDSKFEEYLGLNRESFNRVWETL